MITGITPLSPSLFHFWNEHKVSTTLHRLDPKLGTSVLWFTVLKRYCGVGLGDKEYVESEHIKDPHFPVPRTTGLGQEPDKKGTPEN